MSGESRPCVSCKKATYGQPECPFCKTKQPNKMVRGSTKNQRALDKGASIGLAQFIGTELGAKPTGKSPLLKPKAEGEEEVVAEHEKNEEGQQAAANFASMVVTGASGADGRVMKPSELAARRASLKTTPSAGDLPK